MQLNFQKLILVFISLLKMLMSADNTTEDVSIDVLTPKEDTCASAHPVRDYIPTDEVAYVSCTKLVEIYGVM